MRRAPAVRTYRVGHLFCGIGAGAQGFNEAEPRVGNMTARFECAGGVDVDPGAIENFRLLTGTGGTVLDLFTRQQYIAVNDCEPPFGWEEAGPADIRRALGDRPLNVMFLSAPCKGLSGLLSTKASMAAKYQALNQLTVRGVFLTLEAYRDDPVDIILFENVPRIETRGRKLLIEIEQLLRGYGYVFAETRHDCGEIGGLAQSRKRFLLVARHPGKVPPFLYQPRKSRLRGVGEVIGLMPLPADPIAGEMHRVPALQWKTWVRLAFVPPGRDWRALNELAIENGVLRDYGIVPEKGLRDNQLGVLRWDDTAPTLTGQRSPYQGRFNVADPRVSGAFEGAGRLGVRDWRDPSVTVAGASRPDNGAYSIADPREEGRHHGSLGVKAWEDPASLIAGATRPSNGPHSVADPRVDGHPKSVQIGVRARDEPSGVVTGKMYVGGGPNSVADPRLVGKPRFNNVFRIVPFSGVAPAVAGPGGCGLAVADPRADGGFGGKGKYRITGYDEPSGTVIAGSTTGQGAFALADPRGGEDPTKLHGKHRVEEWNAPSRAVIAGRDNGASAVADPRPLDGRSTMLGVHGWTDTAGVVAGENYPTNGAYCVADPRTTHGLGAHQNKHRVVAFGEPAPVVTGSDRVGSGALSVADPRPGYSKGTHHNLLAVVDYSAAAKTITGATHVAGGALAVADPRPGYKDAHHNVLYVTPYDQPAGTVTSGHGPTTGAISVADPRPVALNGDHRDGYTTQGHYGVVAWDGTAGAIPAYAKHDRGQWSVADPREQEGDPADALPKPTERLVARIIARDETWHRPFTTLELAALQSLFDPSRVFQCENGVWRMGEEFALKGGSDQVKREWIGNAVPSAAAKGMAETIGRTLLLAEMGETFQLSEEAIWVMPLALELAVDPRQSICGEDI